MTAAPKQFTAHRATRAEAKARIALIGPSGSGKTYTALRIAKGLVGDQPGHILLLDSETGSGSKYADEFTFDTIELPGFSPETYRNAIKWGEAKGYVCIIVDSLSHAWMGPDGALNLVDEEAARSSSKNTWAAWRKVTPLHMAMIDSMLRCKAHIIATMRVKTEWVVEKDERTGKTTPRKVGLEPVQRAGMEYEFDVVADLDDEHTLIVSKTRYRELDRAVIKLPGEDLGEVIAGETKARPGPGGEALVAAKGEKPQNPAPASASPLVLDEDPDLEATEEGEAADPEADPFAEGNGKGTTPKRLDIEYQQTVGKSPAPPPEPQPGFAADGTPVSAEGVVAVAGEGMDPEEARLQLEADLLEPPEATDGENAAIRTEGSLRGAIAKARCVGQKAHRALVETLYPGKDVGDLFGEGSDENQRIAVLRLARRRAGR